MPTITIIDGDETLQIINGAPPPLITISTVPPLMVTQIPGVGLVGPQGLTGATGSTGPAGHAQLALSIPGPLSVMTGTMPFIAARATTFHGIAVAVGVAPVGADIIFDVLVDGVTIFTTVGNRPRILDGALEGATVFVPDITAVAAGAVVTVDVIQVGSSVAGSHAVLVVDST